MLRFDTRRGVSVGYPQVVGRCGRVISRLRMLRQRLGLERATATCSPVSSLAGRAPVLKAAASTFALSKGRDCISAMEEISSHCEDVAGAKGIVNVNQFFHQEVT